MHPRRAPIEGARSIPTATMSLTPRPVQWGPLGTPTGTGPFPYITALRIRVSARDTAGRTLVHQESKELVLLLGMGTLNCKVPRGRSDPPAPRPRPHQPRMLTNVTIELVQMLSRSETTSPGVLVLKSSSKSGLPVAWITGHATIPQPSSKIIQMSYINMLPN